MWFDHVGGQDWGKWEFDELFAMMYQLQPKLIVNNRAARFCGPNTEDDRGPASPEIKKMTEGDYYTPEGRIGSMDIERDWESCIHVGKVWSYRGEDGFKGPDAYRQSRYLHADGDDIGVGCTQGAPGRSGNSDRAPPTKRRKRFQRPIYIVIKPLETYLTVKQH